MTNRRLSVAITFVAALSIVPTAPRAQVSAEVAFRAAMETETVKGDLRGAIEQYKKLVDTSEPRIAARALLRIAECYQKLGDPAAAPTYEKVARQYPEQTEIATVARARIPGEKRDPQPRSLALRKVWDGGADGTVSPDGRYLAYPANFNTALFLRDLTSGTERRVTGEQETGGVYGSAISSDGRQIAYNSCPLAADPARQLPCEIRVANLHSTGTPSARRLYVSDEIPSLQPMDWSADGQWIAVSGQRADRSGLIGVVNVHDGALRILKSVDWRGPTKVFFSPDGRHLAFDLPETDSSEQRDVSVLAVDASSETWAVRNPGQDIVMGWTPDGSHLLFASDRSGTMDLWALPFARGTVDKSPVLVKASIGKAASMGVTRDGALYLGVEAGVQDIELAPIDLTTGKQTGPSTRPIQRFFGTNQQPSWSPDGKSLAYVSRRPARALVVAIRTSETGEIRELELRPSLQWMQGLSWAPDMKWLAVFGADLKGRSGIYRIDADSGAVSPIVAPIAPRLTYEGFFWSPDGSRLYYHQANGDITERHLASGRERKIFSGGDAGGGPGNPGPISLSPDGRWIAACASRGVAGSLITSRPSLSVVLIPVDGGQPRELLHVDPPHWVNNTSIPWTPDGRAVLVRKMLVADDEAKCLSSTCIPSELWLVPIDGTSPRKLEFDVNQVATYAAGKIRMHPDGKSLAYLAGDFSSEIWVLENFLPLIGERR